MIRPEQIPDEVVEAAYQRLYTMRPEDIRAAIAAAINAWPGMFHHPARPDEEECIFLPVDQDSTRTAS